ncbi:Basic-leucine zipper (bZIP) transcription factor family [Zostera marina]|uniref:Basic-leucine zipper (BZIP) transcription factor family n=1 Tax=Zostera marina TaxID=29655 RepID=A0A0K9PM29_ZOSMR|nr:Basic-leucine zipper (bZIP) transcription factor family [Zostera marina]
MSLGSDSMKKRKRMESNRESARRSRVRKQKRLEELLNESALLKNENDKIAAEIALIEKQVSVQKSGNVILQTQLIELTDRLTSMSEVLRVVEEFSGMNMDIPEIPDPLLTPWKLPTCASLEILASTNVASSDPFFRF